MSAANHDDLLACIAVVCRSQHVGNAVGDPIGVLAFARDGQAARPGRIRPAHVPLASITARASTTSPDARCSLERLLVAAFRPHLVEVLAPTATTRALNRRCGAISGSLASGAT